MAVTFLVTAAVILSIARIVLPSAGDYKSDIEKWVSDVIGQEIKIDRLDADWHGIEPQLVFSQVEFFSADNRQAGVQFERARIGLDIWQSILQGAVVPGALVVDGARLVVQRGKDGSISLQGLGLAKQDSGAEQGQFFANWILDQRILKLERCELTWVDNKRDTKWKFENVNLELRNSGQRHQIDGSIHLPDTLGTQLVLFLDIRGNFFSGKNWSGNIFLNGANLSLKNWISAYLPKDISIGGGKASFSIWTRWQQAEMEEARGEFNITKLDLQSRRSASAVKLDSILGDFLMENRHQEIRVTLDHLIPVLNSKPWQQTRLDVLVREPQNIIEAESTYINIGDISRFLSVFVDSSNKNLLEFQGMRLAGELRNFSLYMNAGDNANIQYAIASDLEKMSMQPWRKFPGFENLDGELFLSNHDGLARIDSQNWQLSMPKMFSNKFSFVEAKGDFFWHSNREGFFLQGKSLYARTNDAEVFGGFRTHISQDTGAFLDLALKINASDVARVEKYLPDVLMKPGIVSWLGRSLLNGRVSNGGLVYYGELGEYPFRENQGKFLVSLPAQNVNLRFLEEWPEINDIEGELNLYGNGFRFDAKKGSIFSNRLSNTRVELTDFAADIPLLKITGEVDGLSTDKLRYLHASPLEDVFAKSLHDFNVEGDSHLSLDLQFPFADGGELQTNGVLQLTDNRFFAPDLALDFQHINGNLAFTKEGISAENISADLGPFKLKPKIETIKSGQQRHIVFADELMVQEPHYNYIFEHFLASPHWSQYLNGEALMNARFVIPLVTEDENDLTRLELESEFLGLEISLPYPLAKDANERQLFKLSYDVVGEPRGLRIQLGDIQSVFQFNADVGEQYLTQGAIGFGVLPALPENDIFHYSGQLEHFTWAEWQPLLIPPEGQRALLGGNHSTREDVAQVFDVKIDKLNIFSSIFSDARLQIENTAQGWLLVAEGPELSGEIFLPTDWEKSILSMNMQHLHIKLEKSGEDSSIIDPRNLPAIKMKSTDFSFNGMQFGALDLSAIKVANGLQLEKLKMQTKTATIDAQGSWSVQQQGQISDFDIDLKTSDLGQSLLDWKYKKVMAGGDGDLKIKSRWNGSPADFEFAKLTGSLAVDINNSRLLDLEYGAVKMLGLLSLQALPRRLFFDFTDITKEGMKFDSMTGKFDVQNGDAFTNGLLLEGPTAKVAIAGRVGLAKTDYDLVVTFVPSTFDMIPVIGSLSLATLTIQPQIGATLFAFQKLFQTQLDEISAVQYTVAGTWENPEFTKIEKEVEAPQDLLEE